MGCGQRPTQNDGGLGVGSQLISCSMDSWSRTNPDRASPPDSTPKASHLASNWNFPLGPKPALVRLERVCVRNVRLCEAVQCQG